MRKWTGVIPVVASFALSAAVFARLPATARPVLSPILPLAFPPGEPMPRSFIALLLPTLGLAVWILLTTLSKVRTGRPPLPSWWLNEETGAASVQRFEPTYGTISFGVTALIAIMHAGLLAGVLHSPGWIFQVLTAAVGFGMIAIGNVMPRTKPNWIVGLRTKRTLGDPVVWLRTHRLLGALMILAGSIVVITSIVAPRYALVIAVGLLIISFPISHFAGARADKHLETQGPSEA
ncbi:MAG: SdpI family protein [Gemmatimonadaceae bacterium]|nr:SdpI family protein [Gemmatimonadaceae bacterium]